MRLLFLTSTRIGDAVLSTGLLDTFVRRHPGLRVTVVTGAPAAPLFRAVPGLESVIVLRKRPYNAHWPRLWRQVVGRRWDIVVDLRASALSYLLRARQRHVVGRRGGNDRHRVAELGDLLGLDPPPVPRVWLDEVARARAAAAIPGGAGPVLALGPAANWAGKQWPATRFAALAGRLTAPDGPLPGARVAVLAAGGERPQAQPLLDSLPPARRLDLVGALDLPEAAACLQRCALFVGNDSGLMHLAAAAGTPTLGLFGPTPDTRYRPWGAHAAFIRTPESFPDLHAQARRHPATSHTLMDGLSVETVVAKARAMVGESVLPE